MTEKSLPKRGPEPTYDWARWLVPGVETTIRRFVDFDCSVGSMRNQLYNQARMAGGRMEIHKVGDDALCFELHLKPREWTRGSLRANLREAARFEKNAQEAKRREAERQARVEQLKPIEDSIEEWQRKRRKRANATVDHL
jgi:hypothetical protein